MKKLLSLAITGMFLMSCGGGWSEDDQQAFLNDCGNEDSCDCYLKASEKRFDDYAAFMDAWGADELEEWAEEVEEKCEE